MIIGITLNEVLRDFVGQLAYTYTKYINGNFEIKEDEVTSENLMDHFEFQSKDDFNRFIYDEAALEIFGHADQLHDNIMTKFNNFLIDIYDEEEHQIIICGDETMKSIPSTYFFLSKLSCRIKNIKFTTNYNEMWDNVDVLISATPKALEVKPDNKISVKINSSYNKECGADYSLESLIEFMEDEELRDKILNSKITDYEEVK